MTVQGIRGVVEAAIQRAAQATGVDFSFLMKTANRESGMNPAAKAGTSSAAGLFQFVEQTWLSTLKQHGAKHGYGRYAELIAKGSDGRLHVAGDAAHRAVMNLRLDPHAASLMAGELTSDSAAYLKGRTGRAATAGELYAAHFLGPQGSARLIEAAQRQPGTVAAGLFPDAAHANKAIFYRDGRAATVGEVYANLTRAAGHGGVAAEPAPPADDGFIQTASGRRLDRQRQQEAMISLILNGTQPGEAMGAGQRLTGSLFTTEMLKMLSDSQRS
ncbi:transglycosylase SLT domain-containing protein [Phenylobacterium sp.]|uniref:transglycosylase SLT domain-containing protein n=1 Tax=Phenylobacterium sp. TaxID=1871053 RepID=UPI00286D589E|nr:transglycosylase SLT domain-containing protein [Phenylobacterium sp.]